MNYEPNSEFNPTKYHKNRGQQEEIERVRWNTPGLKITRLRLISDPGFPNWDVSYCHGILDGEHVDVQLPFHQVPKGRRRIPFLIEKARKDGLYLKGTGLLNCISTLQ